MAPAPALAAIAGDMLWCLGLGLLLAVGRDAVGLAVGNGRVLCFVWDLLGFLLAAVLLCGFAAGLSASGIARWYMALGMGAGALAWRWAASPAVHALCGALARLLLCPLHVWERRVAAPAREWACIKMASMTALQLNLAKKDAKKAKMRKKELQNPPHILYN